MFKKFVRPLFALVLLCLCAAPCAFATTTLRYSDHDSPGGMRTKFVKDVWIPAIEAQSKGDIKVQALFGGALLGSSEALGGLSDGVVDMAFIFPDFYPKQLLLNQVFKLFPIGPRTWKGQQWLYNKVFTTIPEFSAELTKFNVKPLLITGGLPASFNSKNPMKTLADIKGKKWRASSRWHLDFFKSFGSVPVSVPWGDCFMALQTGVIDGVFANYDGAHLIKVDEAGKHVLVSKALWWGTPFIHAISLDKWKSLSKKDQDALLKASKIAGEKFGAVYDAAYQKIWDEQKKEGIDVRELTPDEIKEWETQSQYKKHQQVWVKEIKAAGYKNADEILAKLQKLVAEAIAREK